MRRENIFKPAIQTFLSTMGLEIFLRMKPLRRDAKYNSRDSQRFTKFHQGFSNKDIPLVGAIRCITAKFFVYNVIKCAECNFPVGELH